MKGWLSALPDWSVPILVFVVPCTIICLIGWIGERITLRNAKIDKKLMFIFNEEFPDYDYNRLKSEILYAYSRLNKCPRCGSLLERRDELPKPVKCTRVGCNYPGL